MKFAWVIAGIAVSVICQTIVAKAPNTLPNVGIGAAAEAESARHLVLAAIADAPLPQLQPSRAREEKRAIDAADQRQARLEGDRFSSLNDSPDPGPPKRDLAYLRYYAYAEIMPDEKPADIVLDSLKNISIGTSLEEIKRASDAFGLDFSFMKTVAKIESGFDPTQRTGSYIGLFQLSHYEFGMYGSGEITSPRDNAIAAAYKFVTEATLFELDTHKDPTFLELYLIHQQGWQGAAEHVSHPERIAWKSMCATDEGREKGEKWCKRAIWRNTLPAVKLAAKSVDNLTSGDFVNMWREQVDVLYARYSATAALETEVAQPLGLETHAAKSHAAKSHVAKSRAAKSRAAKSRIARSHAAKSHVAKSQRRHRSV